jgi:hypothetical protein
MDAADQPSHSPMISGLLLLAEAACSVGILLAGSAATSWFRSVVAVIGVLSMKASSDAGMRRASW